MSGPSDGLRLAELLTVHTVPTPGPDGLRQSTRKYLDRSATITLLQDGSVELHRVYPNGDEHVRIVPPSNINSYVPLPEAKPVATKKKREAA